MRALNEAVAIRLTRAFGTMWLCYAFAVFGLLPLLAIFRPHEDEFLYWSNWVQLWALPLILVGTNLLGRNAERRATEDHEKLARSYEEQKQTYEQVLALLKRQEDVIAAMLRQDRLLQAQDVVLAEQTTMLKAELAYLKAATGA